MKRRIYKWALQKVWPLAIKLGMRIEVYSYGQLWSTYRPSDTTVDFLFVKIDQLKMLNLDDDRFSLELRFDRVAL